MFSPKKSEKLQRNGQTMRPGHSKIPSYFMCPITMDIMEDPTITSCGHMFERTAIVKWLREEANNGCCPLCHQKILESSLSPCYPLKGAIADFKAKKDTASSDGTMLSTLNRKIGGMSFFGGKGKEPELLDGVPKTSVKKRPKAESSANIGVPKQQTNTKLKPGGSASNLNSSVRKKTPNPTGKPWAKLTPILNNSHGALDIASEEFSIGRAHSCDKIVDASEISSVHCLLYRVLRDGSTDFDCFIEDKSTNGTYLNGNRVGKGLVANVTTGDEISLGERFCTKLIPKVASFIEWIFNHVELTPERRADVDRAKKITAFFELADMDDTALRNAGIKSEFVRAKVLEATKNWKEKYRFPAYRIEILDGKPATNSHNRQAKANTIASNRSNPTISSLPDGPSEINFDPADYIERDSAGVVVMNVRRSKGARGTIAVLVKSSEKSPTKPGQLYQPFQRQVVIKEGEMEAVVEFFWKAETQMNTNALIKFEIQIVQGNAHIGPAGLATLTIEMASNRKTKKPSKADDQPSQQHKQRVPEPPHHPSDSDEEEEESETEDSKKALDDELLAIMMDAFPAIDPKDIADVIRKERKTIGPLNDRNLLQDMVAIKLTNLLRGDNELDMTQSNIKLMKLSEKESFEDNQHEIGPPIPPPATKPQQASTPQANAPQPGLMQPMSVQPPAGGPMQAQEPKFRQTILRSELESFLLMASLSLIRKFFNIQGIDCNYTHISSPVVSMAVNLTDMFLKTLENVKPFQSNPNNQTEDLYEFEKLVELFKKYVYQKGAELRANAVPIDPSLAKQGYRYDIASHKSAHHFKMENNHAIIEDLNAFAKLPRDIPPTSFYGVFDGHGGYLISEYLSLHLATNIAKNPQFNKNISEAIRQGYEKTDEFVMKKIFRDKLKGGSTAVTAFIRENTIHVAWAGDARCLLFKRMGGNLVAFPLINPHNPQGAEKNRIVKAGGFVEFIAGKWRVNGRLAVTRSFGDENLKPVVTSEPEYTKIQMTGDEEFLMLSCDGLYDVMDYSDVAEHLEDSVKKGVKLGQLAASLVNEGVTRKSTDDITVLLVNLSRNPNL